MRYYTFLCLVLITKLISAQDLGADLIRVSEKISSNENLSIEIEISVFPKFGDAKPSNKFQANVDRLENNWLVSLGFNTYLFNENYKLYINKHQEEIYVEELERKGRNNKMMKGDFEFNQEEVIRMMRVSLNKADSIEYVGADGNVKAYVVWSSGHLIQISEIFIDTEINFLTQINYYYNSDIVNSNTYVEIKYSSIDFTPAYSPDFFSESRFVTFQEDEIVGANAYKNYTIVTE